MAYDTGANGTVMTEKLATVLGLEITPASKTFHTITQRDQAYVGMVKGLKIAFTDRLGVELDVMVTPGTAAVFLLGTDIISVKPDGPLCLVSELGE